MAKLKDIWKWLKGEGPTLVINAKDGDGDGKVQDGTPFERPAKKAPAKKPVAKKPASTAKKAPAKAPAKKATPKKK